MPLSAFFFDRSALYAYYCAPMSDTLIPEYVDAKKIFAQEAVISGNLPVARFARFSEMLANSSGTVAVSLAFALDGGFRRVISGEISTEVQVLCQRCLDVTNVALTDSFKLAVIDSESFLDKVPPDLEPWVAPEPKLILADILEEQLILCMPIVSYHDYDCLPASDTMKHNGSSDDEPGEQGKPNPFAILQSLKDSK